MSNERRCYFRIEDNVNFTVNTVDKRDLQQKLDAFWSDKHEYAQRRQFNHHIEEHITDFRAIKKTMPELARYLTVLQNQIEDITEKVIPEPPSAFDNTQKVNFSAQGMAYYSDQKLALDDTIELNLQLLPTGQVLKIFAQVVYVESAAASAAEPFKIRLNFTHIHEADKELLIKHIHAQQLKDIAASRLS